MSEKNFQAFYFLAKRHHLYADHSVSFGYNGNSLFRYLL